MANENRGNHVTRDHITSGVRDNYETRDARESYETRDVRENHETRGDRENYAARDHVRNDVRDAYRPRERGTDSSFRSVGSLISRLTHDVTTLVGDEVNLARTELSEKISQATNGIVFIVMAAVIALGGYIVLLMAAVYGISNALAPWLSALIVGIVAAGIGMALLMKGRSNLQARNLMPNRTIRNVQRDEHLAKEQVK